jgi:hypothetical protein
LSAFAWSPGSFVLVVTNSDGPGSLLRLGLCR